MGVSDKGFFAVYRVLDSFCASGCVWGFRLFLDTLASEGYHSTPVYRFKTVGMLLVALSELTYSGLVGVRGAGLIAGKGLQLGLLCVKARKG